MICGQCATAAAADRPSEEHCRNPGWCDCAHKPITPEARAALARRAREALFAMSGYDPTPDEGRELDAELDRRLAASRAPGGNG